METAKEIHDRIFGKPKPKFEEGEVAYTTSSNYPNHYHKVIILRDNGDSVDFRTENLLGCAIAPHYGVWSTDRSARTKLVKESEIPSDGIKLDWLWSK